MMNQKSKGVIAIYLIYTSLSISIICLEIVNRFVDTTVLFGPHELNFK